MWISAIFGIVRVCHPSSVDVEKINVKMDDISLFKITSIDIRPFYQQESTYNYQVEKAA